MEKSLQDKTDIDSKKIVDGIISIMKRKGNTEDLESLTKTFAESSISLPNSNFVFSLNYFKDQLSENFKELNDKDSLNKLSRKTLTDMAKVINSTNISLSENKRELLIEVLSGVNKYEPKFLDTPKSLLKEKLIVSDEIKEIVNYGISLISKENPTKNLSENFKKFAILANVLEGESFRVCIKHFMNELTNKIPEFSQPDKFGTRDLTGDIRESIALSMNNDSYSGDKRQILIAAVTDFDLMSEAVEKRVNQKKI